MAEVQTALKIDGLVGPFWAEVHRHARTYRDEDEALGDLLSTCFHGEEHGSHFVQKIGDAEGVLWRRRPAYDFTWEALSDRAPWPSPYEKWGEA